MPKSIVLLSAGLDSTVNLCCAMQRGLVLRALTFDYGQRAARREAQRSAAMCARLAVPHEIIRLPWLGAITGTALVNRRKRVPHLTGLGAASHRSAARVWVPNRNGVFLAVGAAFAEAFHASEVVAGFNAEEAATFPDNSEAFVRASNRALRLSTLAGVRVKSYTSRMAKPGIVRLGLRLNAPLDLVWPCYEGGRRMCGLCESCLRFRRAVQQAGASELLSSVPAAKPRTQGKSRS